MFSNDIVLYSQVRNLLSLHQRRFFMQQMGTNTKIHSQTLCRKGETVKHSAIMGLSPLNSSSQSSGNLVEEKVERV